jgi:hypothetical protein
LVGVEVNRPECEGAAATARRLGVESQQQRVEGRVVPVVAAM